MKYRRRHIVFLVCGVLVSGCASTPHYAPVVRIRDLPRQLPKQYRVQRGDTIYSIAWKLSQDYRRLAAVNRIAAPYTIYPGQYLRVPQSTSQRRPTSRQTVKPSVELSPSPWASSAKPVHSWVWPVKGRVVKRFSAGWEGTHGIDIAAPRYTRVAASAGGTVVYSGDGVRGYGNLIIIKHNEAYLSAYAYNDRNLVKLGQRVHQGQKIAEVGRNSAGKTMLHFEIRRAGQAVDPMNYLRH